jgi:DNA-binding NarL/FixJ family response regulator
MGARGGEENAADQHASMSCVEESLGAADVTIGKASHRVVLVEDDDRTRMRLAKSIGQNPHFEVLAAAANFHDGKKSLSTYQPDLLVTDLGLPDGSGIDLIRTARSELAGCQIMVITIFGDEKNVISALEAGADGYLLKDATGAEIASALEELIAGGSPMSAPIARHLLQRFRDTSIREPKDQIEAPGVALSGREFEILNLVAKGFSFPEIADLLDVSRHTIRTHVRRMYQKLEVSSKSAAVYEAVHLGLIDLD